MFGDVISVYTRAEAIEDGVLFDVSNIAKQAGIKFPVAITSALWCKICDIPQKYNYQDSIGRLWDVLSVLSLAARNCSGSIINYTIEMPYEVYEDNRKVIKKNIKLKAICGPGDNREPVLTIMLPQED